MLLAFKDHLEKHFPEVLEAKVIVAVSGGIDSVVLAHLCKKSGLNISLAHCNFQLREEESEMDETFVMELADALDLEVFIEEFETEAYANEKKISTQMAARDLRYDWFDELCQTLQFDYVFTAHHANDNLETVLINFIRGTGLEGLTGIPARNECILRPLLPFSRTQIEEYAHDNKLKWREDSSNQSLKYLRNKVRLKVIPELMKLNPQLLESFAKTRSYLEQSHDLIEDYISAIFPKIAKEEDFGYSFKIKPLKTLPNTEAVMYALFRTFGFTEWEDVHGLLDAQSGKMVFSKTHRLIKDREELLLTTIPQDNDKSFEIREGEEVVMLPIGTFQFEEVSKITKEQKDKLIFVDYARLKFPLTVRKWERGDYFYPYGMQGKKKLSKFFKDEKLSLPQKENCWLLCSGEDIVWVIGQRLDGRFAVDDDTKNIISISFTT